MITMKRRGNIVLAGINWAHSLLLLTYTGTEFVESTLHRAGSKHYTIELQTRIPGSYLCELSRPNAAASVAHKCALWNRAAADSFGGGEIEISRGLVQWFIIMRGSRGVAYIIVLHNGVPHPHRPARQIFRVTNVRY